MRHVPAAEHDQALISGDGLDDGQRVTAAARVGGQERQPGRVAARRGQLEGADSAEQLIGNLGQDAGAVAGLRVSALGAAVVQVAQDRQGLADSFMPGGPR